MKNNRMTFRQAKAEFSRNFVFDEADKPAAGEAWCMFIDCLHRDGRITDQQVSNWDNPYHS